MAHPDNRHTEGCGGIARFSLCAALAMGLATSGLRGDQPQAKPVSPPEIVRLFDGHGLSGLSTWLDDTKHNDPRRVFRVTDGLLHITGDGFGYIATDNTTALRADAARNTAILARIPAGRWGDSEDLAGAVVYLASPASDYVSGTVMTVDGGWMGR